MTRAVACLRSRADMLGLPPPFEERIRRARLIGNALRELDHFLNILVQAVRSTVVGDSSADRRNTARELRGLRAALSLPDPSHLRLRALGRSRACLFHCGGVVRRADMRGGAWMTAGWSSDGRALDRLALGETLWPNSAHLVDTCRFYQAIADQLAALAPFSLSYSDMTMQKDAMRALAPSPRLASPPEFAAGTA